MVPANGADPTILSGGSQTHDIDVRHAPCGHHRRGGFPVGLQRATRPRARVGLAVNYESRSAAAASRSLSFLLFRFPFTPPF